MYSLKLSIVFCANDVLENSVFSIFCRVLWGSCSNMTVLDSKCLPFASCENCTESVEAAKFPSFLMISVEGRGELNVAGSA